MTSARGNLLIGLLVLGLAIAAVVKTWLTGSWGDNFYEIIGGLVAFFLPDQFASCQRYRAWRMNQWRFPPSAWAKVIGFVLVVFSAGIILLKQ